MLKFVEKNGKITANLAWVMTEAWAIVNRFKAMGVKRSMSEALKLAWFTAKMEVSVQIKIRGQMNQIAKLAALGKDRLREMESDIENIDRHTYADTTRLSEIRSALQRAA
jgi:hypothetical protein